MQYDEVLKSTMDFFQNSELASQVWTGKYALQSEGDYKESNPNDMFKRISDELFRIEKKYPNALTLKTISNYLQDFSQIIPQGSPMFGIGNTYQTVSLGNCFVADSPHDSYGGIMHTDQQLAQLMKRRAGVGVDISTIRPKGLKVNNAAKTTSGIIGFMERFSNTCREVGQEGRRGAEILVLNVHHPEVKSFIMVKRDLKKVTGANISIKFTDEFMNALLNDEEYEQRFPIDSATPLISKKVKAKEIWDLFIESAWFSAEPGALFWDTVNKFSPAHNYGKLNPKFYNKACNPCLTGDTLVAVADGRNSISIKQLAEEGKDVPVYALGDDKKVVIKMMRNPRITGYDKDVYKVTLDDGNSFKATSNHKMIMSDGVTYKEIKDLQIGDSLHIAIKSEATMEEVRTGSNSKSQKYYWIKNEFSKYLQSEHRMIYEFYNGKIPKGHVIHHIDHKALNNNISNLQCISKEDHAKLHAKDMMGLNNPIYKIKADPVRFKEYSEKMSISCSGAKNGNALEVSNENLKNHIISLTLKLGRRIGKSDWSDYAKENGLPITFTKYRTDYIGEDPFYSIAQELGFFVTKNRKLGEIHKAAIDQGYETQVIDETVFVYRICEECGDKYLIPYSMREISFCSMECSIAYVTKKEMKKQVLVNLNRDKRRIEGLKVKQMSAYTKVKFDLGRNPEYSEWKNECESSGISTELKNKFGFYSYENLSKAALNFNHRIVSIEYAGKETVYNGTVDDVHNFYFGYFDRINASTGKNEFVLLNNLQCGEIVMSADSCRLVSVLVSYFVKNKFLPSAYFDFEEFEKTAYDAQKMMDDIIDLEIEKMHAIIEKIKLDPEPDEIKNIELNMWNDYLDTAIKGRRTGLGTTGIGDTIACLNMRYGSRESIELVEKIYKTLALGAYKASIDMAKDRGSFPIFDLKIDQDNEFIPRILSELPKEYVNKYKKYGRRNIAILTTAPTGSISLLAKFAEDENKKYFGVTSGIEPVFIEEHTRRKKINPNDVNLKVDFIDDLGDKWTNFKVFHPAYEYWINNIKKSDEDKNPFEGSRSNDVDWEASVELQAVAQKWIDHSISKTCNLPNDISQDVVSNVYLEAWKKGCKGFTVYRDGSRSGVLIHNEDENKTKEDKFEDVDSFKRPEKVETKIYYSNIDKSKWLIIVGLVQGKPYEIFGGIIPDDKVDELKKLEDGYLIKKSRGHYDLMDSEDNVLINNISKTLNNSIYNFHTRMLSMSLRHGVSVQYLVEQLQKLGDKEVGLYTFNKVISRVLKKYIKDGTKTNNGHCPNCSSTNLMYVEGCLQCSDCGYSKCG